jgi:DNA polymerase I-like protein with 3'-5' exonuclease and polymerase domains
LLKADFPAIQLRIAARLAPDLALQEAFQTGQDPHRLTASTILGKPLAEIDLKDRQKAKAVNFGFIFGMGWKGLMDYACTTYGVKMSESDAQNYRERFFAVYQGIAHWHRDLKAELNAKGEVETISIIGRKARASSLYTASNYCVQGSEADILKLAVVHFSKDLMGADLNTQARIVNLVHDSIWVETSESHAKEVGKLLKEAMESTAEELLELPTPVKPVEIP